VRTKFIVDGQSFRDLTAAQIERIAKSEGAFLQECAK
jgi:hypothetical protein